MSWSYFYWSVHRAPVIDRYGDRSFEDWSSYRSFYDRSGHSQRLTGPVTGQLMTIPVTGQSITDPVTSQLLIGPVTDFPVCLAILLQESDHLLSSFVLLSATRQLVFVGSSCGFKNSSVF
ncbi:hypothetical protein DPMN_162966 [Dreissena polymorpha]|uniref:Uncharacterized protein n=1 Tax=Dreissena polymorpha TaxID=45954 RepID=A0A9D4IU06_DREPO|nr:hypothetical protein DPMN_162966 [Dreissena polymorpha]